VKTRVFLNRHGATELATEGRLAGTTDVSLSLVGREPARRLRGRLAHAGVAAVYASPLGRAMETAAILAEPHGLPVVARVREIAHGHWEGMTRTEVERMHGEAYARWERNPYTFAPARDETGLSVTPRALPALFDIVAAHPGQTLIVVSHKATIRLLLRSLLGFDPRFYRDHRDQSPAASMSSTSGRTSTRA
jgi:broad specificity phosphatase PhoE